MRKIKNILLLVIVFCMFGTINAYAADPQVSLQGDASAKAGETKTLEVKIKADEDIRRNAI